MHTKHIADFCTIAGTQKQPYKMQHVLDNPAWNALLSGNSNLAMGTDKVKYFDPEVSPFVGFRENTAENFQQLYEVAQVGRPFGFISPVEAEIPAPWQQIVYIECLQMVHDGRDTGLSSVSLTPLTEKHIPRMLSLTKLTNPGPFAERTIEFGHYHGVMDGDKLVAMAGQRMHVFNYAEVSAVCTHPDYLGRGYAKQVLQFQTQRILAAGDTPFLHVRSDNHRAIHVYQSLGFATRKTIHFYIIKK
ncbi:GNAT family N-acetyltransferase [Mucilaginibacter psychrotolerans]|uniref:GNAT family N-acetyltransferase n=1 Tax=Mucilaginibacter psychrotolerans TaxID=1524096 RepID=A0A4Y8SPE1_9SPHI|nr:GNAT family N-acetyltransferase [Mucilaginibacter psychrotolerans]TFF40304.1 GNAT family N-acetyltransferase [Mucilaginibacter psychrotolerans]